MPYREPTLLGTSDDASSLLSSKKIDKVMIVTDATVKKLGLTSDIEGSLKAHNIGYVIYDKVVANPTTDNVEEALAIYKKEKCKGLIAVGGGSPIDCAKAVGARYANPRKSCNQMAGVLKVTHKIPLLIAVPTTAGTGSETTLAAVIVDSKTRHKYAINAFHLIPRYALLDYKLTLNLPKSVTAMTGMDALTHAVEAYIGRSTTKDTRRDAKLAVEL
ncbi:MAG: iron-containing alcohol dehydrogenase, partial [Coprobacillus sp.]|nr:iron-containing alcohol dehydrogenase [Coprobacillus sp.]